MYTREIEVPAPGDDDDPEKVNVEDASKSQLEEIVAANREFHEMQAERNRQAQERINRRREEQRDRPLNVAHTNVEAIRTEDLEDSDIPAPGQKHREGNGNE